MIAARLSGPADFAGWRAEARRLAQGSVPPDNIDWSYEDGNDDLFDMQGQPQPAVGHRELTVPRRFIALAEAAICHSDRGRFSLLYRLLWRLQQQPALLDDSVDADVARTEAMARSVRRDLHKMTAFVRFRAVSGGGEDGPFVAWFEPEHFILERAAGFFTARFAAMFWSILTPQGSMHWDGETLRFGPPASRADIPDDDRMEAYWRTYYASIFNPARLKIAAMRAEMPVKYWRNLPEAALIAPLIADAARRAEGMILQPPTQSPARHLRGQQRVATADTLSGETFATWQDAAAAARECRRCPLHCHATQSVFGEGPLDAPVIFVGEQPGDQEDLAGRPFVGPAGRLFDAALEEAGLARERAYVTNAVKHFKFTLRGKRRIHERPNAGEVSACRFWIGIERQFLRPQLIVALGATAVSSMMGRTMSLSSVRGRDVALADGAPMLATVHPSYLLRLPDEAHEREERDRFVADLRRVGELVPELTRRRAA